MKGQSESGLAFHVFLWITKFRYAQEKKYFMYEQ